jgi:hypothetical protein
MRNLVRLAGLAVAVTASVSCGDVVRDGRSPSFLTINILQGQRGGGPATFGNPLLSDVVTNVTSPAPCSSVAPCPTIFNDLGQVTLRLTPKDVTATNPTSNNDVTISRYRVVYRRADGRNVQGVDVPFAFDGAVTGTVPANGTLTIPFEIVRHIAKMEAPLVQLVASPTVISTLTDVTFYGQDRVGNDITVTGTIQIDFGNFGDF